MLRCTESYVTRREKPPLIGGASEFALTMPKDKDKGKRKKTRKPYSGIEAHKRQKKKLVPPLMAIPGVSLQSWMNHRLPEMVWAALLISGLGRERALELFRNVAELVPKLPIEKRMVQPTLCGPCGTRESNPSPFSLYDLLGCGSQRHS